MTRTPAADALRGLDASRRAPHDLTDGQVRPQANPPLVPAVPCARAASGWPRAGAGAIATLEVVPAARCEARRARCAASLREAREDPPEARDRTWTDA